MSDMILFAVLLLDNNKYSYLFGFS